MSGTAFGAHNFYRLKRSQIYKRYQIVNLSVKSDNTNVKRVHRLWVCSEHIDEPIKTIV